jgi:hypothetical protein
MARFVKDQTAFAVGEIDPLVRGRLDLQQYENAVAKGRNVIFLPQGGFRWRPGSLFAMQIPPAALPENGGRLVPFTFSVDDSYMLLFVNLRMYVFKNGALVENINGITDQDYLPTPIFWPQFAELNWTQYADTLILVEKDMPPHRVMRGATDAAWSIAGIAFDAIPKYAFTVVNTPVAQTLTLSATSGNIVATAGGGTPFTAAMIGGYINANPQGRARIIGLNSDPAAEVSAVVDIAFAGSTVASGEWDIETGYEDVWSLTRGWPRSCAFHEGRLFFGGSKSRPQTIWGSKSGFPFNFGVANAYADDAVENTIGTGRYDTVIDMLSGRDLQIFSTGGEYYVPQAPGEPITPDNFFIKGATSNGAKPGVRVQQLDSGTLFLQRQGKALDEFLYTDVELTYVSNKISLLSGHFLQEPSRMALRRSTSTDEGDLLLIVNGADGSMGAWMLLRSQNVIAPSLWTTDGRYLDVGVSVTDIYAVTSRTCSNETKYYVEVFDSTIDTDCAFLGGIASSFSGIPFPCKTLDLLCDGFYQGRVQATTGGVITFPRPSEIAYELGIPFVPYVTTLPPDPRIAAGSRMGFKKRIPQVNVMVEKTRHLTVNGQAVSFRRLGAEILDQPPPEFTGIRRVSGLLGWSTEAQVTVSRAVPLQATVLALDIRIGTGGGT